MMPGDPYNALYWKTLIAELMQGIPLTAPVNPPMEDKLATRVARSNPSN